MTDTQDMPASETRLAWVTPQLVHLGDMDDVKGNGARPPNDASASPSVAAS